jgi:hypothetical protein
VRNWAPALCQWHCQGSQIPTVSRYPGMPNQFRSILSAPSQTSLVSACLLNPYPHHHFRKQFRKLTCQSDRWRLQRRTLSPQTDGRKKTPPPRFPRPEMYQLIIPGNGLAGRNHVADHVADHMVGHSNRAEERHTAPRGRHKDRRRPR